MKRYMLEDLTDKHFKSARSVQQMLEEGVAKESQRARRARFTSCGRMAHLFRFII